MSAVITVLAVAFCLGTGMLRVLLPLFGISLPGMTAW